MPVVTSRNRRPRRKIALTIKGDPNWHTWIKDAAHHLKISISDLVDISIVEHMRGRGYDEPPPPR